MKLTLLGHTLSCHVFILQLLFLVGYILEDGFNFNLILDRVLNPMVVTVIHSLGASATFACILTIDFVNLKVVEIFSILDQRVTPERIKMVRRIWIGLFVVTIPWLVIPGEAYSNSDTASITKKVYK